MPIRFRCQYCTQLMGIARRKAGTMVACTRCTKQIRVPTADEDDNPRVPPPVVPSVPPVPGRNQVPLFDRPDFEQQLDNDDPASLDQPQMSVLGARQPPPMLDPNVPAGPVEYDVEPVDPNTLTPAGGFVLTTIQVTLLTLTVILLLLIAFGAGLLVGKYVL